MSSTEKRATEAAAEADGAKKPKTEDAQTSFIPTVGEAAAQIDEVSQNELTNTGAEDSEGRPVQELESLCMNCHKNGTTRLLMTKIPFFREIIVMSFECPHCGFRNSEIQPAAMIQEKGSKFILKLETPHDLSRDVIKSESATCKFLGLDVEIPAKRGQFTSPEGLLNQIITDLSGDQPARKDVDPESYEKIEQFLARVAKVISGESLPETFVLDDPAGNSWVEYIPGDMQHKWSHVQYVRTEEQAEQLGLAPPAATQEGDGAARKDLRNVSATRALADEILSIESLRDEVQTFNTACPNCQNECPTHMKVVSIPHFKDVIIMSTVCDSCGFKTNEVKTGGAIPDKGRRIVLKVDDPEDLSRDILKSETCGVTMPELELDLTPGTLGGRFTTLEGLLTEVKDDLENRVLSQTSDSMEEATKQRWTTFLDRLQLAIDGKVKFTLLMEDPLAASYIQNVYAPDPDPNMATEDYERTQEENDDLGISDMVV